MRLSKNSYDYLSDVMQLDVEWLIKEVGLWDDNLKEDVSRYIEAAVSVLQADTNLHEIDELYKRILEKEEYEHRNKELVEIWVIFRHFSGLTSRHSSVLTGKDYKYDVGHFLEVQQCEDWHPKILIRREILPNDRSLLDEEVVIYRGCDLAELGDGNYGQYWTLDPEEAEKFAYKYYEHMDWFNKSKRVVLSATIPNSKIFYYRKDNREQEVVVDTDFLYDIRRL